MQAKYRLTIKGKPYGPEYPSKYEAAQAFVRLWPVMHGLGWAKCQ